MPTKLCATCTERHEPPRGAGCMRVLNKLMASMEMLQAEVTALKKQQSNPQVPTTTDQRTVQEDPNEGGSGMPQTVGSAASLHSKAALQEAIKLRLQALGLKDKDSTADKDNEAPRGAAARRKPKKSGRKCTAADRVKVPVEWPHYHTYRVPARTWQHTMTWQSWSLCMDLSPPSLLVGLMQGTRPSRCAICSTSCWMRQTLVGRLHGTLTALCCRRWRLGTSHGMTTMPSGIYGACTATGWPVSLQHWTMALRLSPKAHFTASALRRASAPTVLITAQYVVRYAISVHTVFMCRAVH